MMYDVKLDFDSIIQKLMNMNNHESMKWTGYLERTTKNNYNSILFYANTCNCKSNWALAKLGPNLKPRSNILDLKPQIKPTTEI